MVEDTAAPERLEDVKGEGRIPQAFCLGPVALGLLALALALGPFVAHAVSNRRLLAEDRYASAGLLVAGLGLVAWDIVRRKRRVTLVPLEEGVAVYEARALQGLHAVRSFALVKRDPGFLWYLWGFLALLAALGWGEASGRRPALEKAFHLLCIGGPLLLWWGSTFWARTRCRKLMVPLSDERERAVFVRAEVFDRGFPRVETRGN